MEDKFLNLTYQENKLIRYLQSLEKENQRKCFRALDLAKMEHMSQFRDSGVSYYIHPLRTTLILVEELGIEDIDLLCSALLHDVLEDGSVSQLRLEKDFGLEVARIVKGVTRLRPLRETEEEKKVNKAEKFKEIAQADEKIRLIKLCDILDNMRSIDYIPEFSPARKKITRWREELQNHALPIAQKTNQTLYNELSSLII
jgi:GTP diphosphokinase / guanosine-3',5'-bis(diphosphate) 3'-diphosphatase